MEKLTAFVSRFDGEKTSSSEDILVHSSRNSTSPVFSPSSSNAFNIANILSNDTGSRYRREVQEEEHLQDSNKAEASKLRHSLNALTNFIFDWTIVYRILFKRGVGVGFEMAK